MSERCDLITHDVINVSGSSQTRSAHESETFNVGDMKHFVRERKDPLQVRTRQTVFFLPVDPMDKNHKDPETIDFSVPRRAQYLHKAWKRHQDAVYWVDINLALKKGLKFYQTRSNAIILHQNTPSLLHPESCSDRNWRSHIRESMCVTSSSSKDFFGT